MAGTSDAEAHFAAHEADEDALTGALGQAIAGQPIVFTRNGFQYQIDMSYRKLRGRGRDAPENRFGADGVFQIQVSDINGAVVQQKALPFQAKKDWRRKNKQLVKQCQDMVNELGQGLVIDFSATGYSACQASEAIETDGRPRTLRDQGRFRDLGHVLADDFLPCRLGVPNLFYDPTSEDFTRLPILREAPVHAVTTVVRRLR